MANNVYMVELDYNCAEEAMDYLDSRGYGEYIVIIDDDMLQVTINPEEIELDDILDLLEDGEFDYTVDIEEEVYEEVDDDTEVEDVDEIADDV